jgi:2-polyprenyl-3-methyl-5-hydroxy-6-metoxy-1,4-benzoquinol methylase
MTAAVMSEMRSLLSALVTRIRRGLIIPYWGVQGVHIDPAEVSPPDPRQWSQHTQAVWFSPEMQVFRDCLSLTGLDVRNAVLDDLSKYYNLTAEECRQRCLHWEAWSVREWEQTDRSTRKGIQAFYDSVQSWSFDLMWFAYLQASGHRYPMSVVAARFARDHSPGRDHLDFGSGVGITSQLFARLGFSSTLSDVSTPLLDFASWRLARHGDRATFINLASAALPTNAFDIVTAFDTLVHVPDIDETANKLHRAVRPGGWLLTNFDIREKGIAESAWHLHNNGLRLEDRLERAGFARQRIHDTISHCFQRVDPTSFSHKTRLIKNRLVMPMRIVDAGARRVRWPTPRRLGRLILHLLKSFLHQR